MESFDEAIILLFGIGYAILSINSNAFAFAPDILGVLEGIFFLEMLLPNGLGEIMLRPTDASDRLYERPLSVS